MGVQGRENQNFGFLTILKSRLQAGCILVLIQITEIVSILKY